MTNLIHIADRVLNRPLLVTREKAQVILSVLAGRIGVNAPDASRFEGSDYTVDENGRVRGTPYRISQGVAIITITGSLVNRGAWVGANSGLTSYEGIQHQLKTAMADPNVRAVILDMATPGGEATGAFETADMVRKLAAVKPVTALVNGMAASAGYAIASGATRIVTTETGVSGSIGVVLLHADYSRNLDAEGITPTLIFAGAHKIDGNPFEPLPDTVRADLQAEVDSFYEMFVKSVAKGRGDRMAADAVRETQARTFIGKQAVAVGLADAVGTFETVLADLQRSTASPRGQARPTSMTKGKTMDANTDAPAAEAGISKTEHDAAVKSAEQRGAQVATARLVAVLGAEKIKGDSARMAAAMDLAVKAPGMSAEDVIGFVTANVAEAPKPGAAADVLARLDKAAEGVESRPSATGDTGAPQTFAATPEGWRAEWSAKADLQAEYPTADAYVAIKKREARKAA